MSLFPRPRAGEGMEIPVLLRGGRCQTPFLERKQKGHRFRWPFHYSISIVWQE
jgi:hypothetical protein